MLTLWWAGRSGRPSGARRRGAVPAAAAGGRSGAAQTAVPRPGEVGIGNGERAGGKGPAGTHRDPQILLLALHRTSPAIPPSFWERCPSALGALAGLGLGFNGPVLLSAPEQAGQESIFQLYGHVQQTQSAAFSSGSCRGHIPARCGSCGRAG